MTNEQKILRYAKTLYNTCKRISKETHCKDCPFTAMYENGCTLYGHPIEWDDKFKKR